MHCKNGKIPRMYSIELETQFTYLNFRLVKLKQILGFLLGVRFCKVSKLTGNDRLFNFYTQQALYIQ